MTINETILPTDLLFPSDPCFKFSCSELELQIVTRQIELIRGIEKALEKRRFAKNGLPQLSQVSFYSANCSELVCKNS